MRSEARKELAITLAAAILLLFAVAIVNESFALNQTERCPVTKPNGNLPPGERASQYAYGNGTIWTQLWPDGTVVFRPGGSGQILPDGSLSMKFPWWRGVPGKLSIRGRRIDAPAPPLRSNIRDGYGNIGFQATDVIFPNQGCWEVTGAVGKDSLRFVTRVVRVGQTNTKHDNQVR
jgi:hypothetical protein